ncbi:C6 transcription factor-like protein [Byssothecium circinans]|uniref:C6 transcription factor-like protein n=1 Tax=Byssothecium circinans TaxID=147558 RepID=A0A6A5TEQ5_9PLEO|nr:C6 transcription factor-like protein [Byssothecium circinans]
MASSSIQSRPYRSHRVPACIRCRSRKIRCHIDIPGEPCLACRTASQPKEGRLKCHYVDQSAKTSPSEGGSRQTSKRRRLSNHDNGDVPLRSSSVPILHKSSSHPSASIILAPHIAEDVDILQRHIANHPTTDASASQPYQTLSRDVKDPIVYLTVPRFRTGLAPELGAGREQLEIIQQLAGPFKREILDLYIDHVHPSFPVLDNQTCVLVRSGQTEKLPNNVLCVVYAMGLAHWAFSDTLKMHPRPDMHYVWNKAISAVLEDFLSPSMATVSSAILDQIGRPSVSIISNITLCGRTVSLAQSFGLHRDPSMWNITAHEKSIRIRLWWGVLITDYWSSIAYGVLPHTSKRFYDVPKPTLEMLVPARPTTTQKYATTCFVHLCGLTELLGEILPLVYEIEPDRVALSDSVDRLKLRLNELERELPEWLPLPKKPGSSNLWFCFLSMRLLLNRVTLRAAILAGDAGLEKARLDELRASSSAVLEFVLWLEQSQFLDFWFPYATHLLVHAVTVSLRCSVENENVEARNASVSQLQRAMEHIRHARDDYDWDIANYCLERCSDSVSKVASLTAAPQAEEPPDVYGGTNAGNDTLDDDPSLLLSDLLDPNAFDFSWEALWDTPSGMINFAI